MVVWRIHLAQFPPSSFEGEVIFGGRFNSAGVPAFYTGTNPSVSILELRVHLFETPSATYHMSCTEVDEDLLFNAKNFEHWDKPDMCRKLADPILHEPNHLGLVVPSYVSEGFDYNVVLNPNHPKFKKLKWKSEPYKFDERLWSGLA